MKRNRYARARGLAQLRIKENAHGEAAGAR